MLCHHILNSEISLLNLLMLFSTNEHKKQETQETSQLNRKYMYVRLQIHYELYCMRRQAHASY